MQPDAARSRARSAENASSKRILPHQEIVWPVRASAVRALSSAAGARPVDEVKASLPGFVNQGADLSEQHVGQGCLIPRDIVQSNIAERALLPVAPVATVSLFQCPRTRGGAWGSDCRVWRGNARAVRHRSGCRVRTSVDQARCKPVLKRNLPFDRQFAADGSPPGNREGTAADALRRPASHNPRSEIAERPAIVAVPNSRNRRPSRPWCLAAGS